MHQKYFLKNIYIFNITTSKSLKKTPKMHQFDIF